MMDFKRVFAGFVYLVVVVVVNLMLDGANFCNGARTGDFLRKKDPSLDMPLDSDVFTIPSGYNAPQQVHITQGDQEGRGMIVSWVTPDEPGSNTVLYWAENSEFKNSANGVVVTYKYYNYTSGYIHHCSIKNEQ